MQQDPSSQSVVSLGSDKSDDFAAHAERLRRDGSPQAALEHARAGLASRPHHVAGRVALALALFDLERREEARRELESIIRVTQELAEVATPLPELADEEVERAFDEAAPESDAMLDAEYIAMKAVHDVEEEGPHQGPELPSEAFRTQTMAHLLERQGDVEGAEAIRAGLRQEVDERPLRGGRRIAMLERWLANLRRGH
jgi:hypothetical protein